MKIYTIWAMYEDEFIELVSAYDEGTLYNNPDYWVEELEKAKKALASKDYQAYREITITVNGTDIRDAFKVPKIRGDARKK